LARQYVKNITVDLFLLVIDQAILFVIYIPCNVERLKMWPWHD